MEDDLANECIRPLHSIQIPLLAQIIDFVHAFALRKIVTQKSRIGQEAPPLPCDLRHSNVYGHTLLAYLMGEVTRRWDGFLV